MTQHLILQPNIAKILAGGVARQLREWGETVCGVSVIEGEGKVAFGFEIISDEPKWRKSVEVTYGRLRATDVRDELNDWREHVKLDILAHKPSQVVRGAIQHFGQRAVEEALEVRRAH